METIGYIMAAGLVAEHKMSSSHIEVLFATDARVVAKRSRFVPQVGDIIDFPLFDRSTSEPMMAYRVAERRWLFPTEWEQNKVLVVLSPHEAVSRPPYVGVSGSETSAIDGAEAGE